MRGTQALKIAAIALLCSQLSPLPAAAQTPPRYDIMSVEAGETRRVISVRLSSRMSEDDLARIAAKERKADEAAGRRTLVNFYLPGMKLSDACWASASYAPQLKITVNGLTPDEESEFRALAAAEKRAAVGMWLTEAPAAPGFLVIYREKGRTYADWRLRGGHRTVEEVAENRVAHGRRFDIVGDPNQHYVLVSGGALELREKKGLITIAEPLKLAAAPLAQKDERAKTAGVASPPPPVAPSAPVAAALMRPVPLTPSPAQAQGAGFTITESEAAPRATQVSPASTPSTGLETASTPDIALPVAAQKSFATSAPNAAKIAVVAKARVPSKNAKTEHKGPAARPDRTAKANSAPAQPTTYKYQSSLDDAARRFVN